MGKISLLLITMLEGLHHSFMIPPLLQIDQLIPLNYTKTFSLIAETFKFYGFDHFMDEVSWNYFSFVERNFGHRSHLLCGFCVDLQLWSTNSPQSLQFWVVIWYSLLDFFRKFLLIFFFVNLRSITGFGFEVSFFHNFFSIQSIIFTDFPFFTQNFN